MKRSGLSNKQMLSCLFIAAVLVCASAGSWIRPGAESAGLQFSVQYSYILLPVVLVFMGVVNKSFGFRIRAALIVLGHASFYVMVFLLVKRAGILMNIGEVSLAETISWTTPLFKAAIMLSVVSFAVDILLLRDIRKHE